MKIVQSVCCAAIVVSVALGSQPRSEVQRMIHRAHRKASILQHQQSAVHSEIESIKQKALQARKYLQREECDAVGDCFPIGVTASIHDGTGMVWCKDCSDPQSAGAYSEELYRPMHIADQNFSLIPLAHSALFQTNAADTWQTAHCPTGFEVQGPVVIAVPNHLEADAANPLGDAVVLVHRGGVPVVTKARRAQAAGAVALVVVDSGACDEDFNCDGRLGNRSDGPLAARDSRGAWDTVFIPVVMITRASGERLLAQMALREMEMPGFGVQKFVN